MKWRDKLTAGRLLRVGTTVTRGTIDAMGGGGGNPVGGEGDSGDPLPAIIIKDVPSKARFFARQVAISQVDPEWGFYNRTERRRLAALSRHHGKGYTK